MNIKLRQKAPYPESPESGARSSSAQTIYREIYRAILDHRLPPGTKLPEDAIGEIYGVSRTVVRRVLGRLGHENIVDMRRHRTATVARPSIQEARDIFRSRIVIEIEIARQASRKASAEQIEELRRIVEEEKSAAAKSDRRDQIYLSGAYHVRLAEIGGNTVLTSFLTELVSRTSLIIALYEAPGKSACSFNEHSELTESIAARDGERAAALMQSHLESCQSQLRLVNAGDPVDLAEALKDR